MNKGKAWRIKGARILDPAQGRDYLGDVCALHGKIVDWIPNGIEVVEFGGEGMFVVPGLATILRTPCAFSSARTICAFCSSV